MSAVLERSSLTAGTAGLELEAGDMRMDDGGSLRTLLPSGGGEVSVEAVLRSQRACAEDEVLLVDDEEVEDEVVEVWGDGRVTFGCAGASSRFAVLYVKQLGRFFSVEAEVTDEDGGKRVIRAGNKTSKLRLKPKEVLVPMTVAEGWNYVVLDLEMLTRHAFGKEFAALRKLHINAHCRLWKAYLADRPYAEPELPAHLRVSV
eukprot:PLAT8108.1.p1 GENE.PLAT8108.1~~PLAT8108.1.p1  ORF type:complete len:203 (-),score=71.67 PLAT8108.1:114-722(-)